MASDAFFPFRDCVDEAPKWGSPPSSSPEALYVMTIPFAPPTNTGSRWSLRACATSDIETHSCHHWRRVDWGFLGAALRRSKRYRVLGIARRPSTLREAKRLGAIDAGSTNLTDVYQAISW